MDSLQSHPIRQPVVDLWNELTALREPEKPLLKAIAEAEKKARVLCNEKCPAEDKWTRDNYPYAELYCRYCGTSKR
mgnify:CR=1 FL=1